VVFGVSVLLGFVVWGVIGARYIWPALLSRPRTEALRPILLLHAFRFVGLAFVVPGVAFYQGNRVGITPGQQGAAYFIPTVLVPLLLVTHALVFRILVRTTAEVRHHGHSAA
jgi:hypothetical protein